MEDEKVKFKLELKEDLIRLSYQNISPLGVLGYLCKGILLDMQDDLTIEEICALTKNILVKIDNELKEG